MEKSSEKLIRSGSAQRNPFEQMLSEVHLQLPQATQKQPPENNVVLVYDPYIDRNSYKTIEQPKAKTANKQDFKGSRAQTRREAGRSLMTGSQLIRQWMVSYMSQKELIGPHWQNRLQLKKKQLMEEGFNSIKICNLESNCTFSPSLQKTKIFCKSLQEVRLSQLKYSFLMIYQFSKDEELFGLSNTIHKETLSHSHIIEVDGSKPQDEPPFIPPLSTSANKNQKGSEMGGVQDLSKIIQNHPKLHLSGVINQSLPNIPKSLKNSSKRLPTSKDLGDLPLSTSNNISSSKRLDNQDLPLNSRKDIQTIGSEKDHVLEASSIHHQPITITYILNRLDLSNLIHPQHCSQTSEQEPVIKNILPNQHHQGINRNVLISDRPRQNQHRQMSLGVKPFALVGYPERVQPQLAGSKVINTSEYYQKGFNYREEGSGRYEDKSRRILSAPKIKFTFSSCEPPRSSHHKQSTLQNHDCIKESSLLPGSPSTQQSSHQGSIHSIPRKVPHKDRGVAPRRQNINDSLLPSPYDQYYFQEEVRNRRKSLTKVPMLSSSVSAQGIQPDGDLYGARVNVKMVEARERGFSSRSPKDKLLVTCSSKGKLGCVK